MTSAGTPAPFAFFRLATSYQITQAISVAAKLGIADRLSDGPKTLDELARAKLLVIDIVDADTDKPKVAAFGDLNLLLLFGGRQRTESEFHTLFDSVGFAITRILPTQSHFKLVEAIPI
jgi:hypothetical protein